MEAMTQAPIVCAGCGAALAADQRYCLHCGAAQGDPRVAYRELIDPARAAANGAGANGAAVHHPGPANGAAPSHAATPSHRLAPPRDWTPVIALGGLGTLALVLVVGVLIGKSGSSSQPAAAAPQVITIAGGTAAPAAATTDATVSEDWPAGTTGFTVELGTLSKDGTTSAQVDAAKTAAAAKGADDVGVLDSDAHGSLPGGSYIIYSGVFDKKAGAKQALAKLQGDAYPDAKVIAVNDGADGGSSTASSADTKAGEQAVQDLDNATGDDYQKKSSKLPDTVALPGKPPAKDNKAPGGGSGGGETIG